MTSMKEGEEMEQLGFGLKRTLLIMSIASLFMCITALLCQQGDALPSLLTGIATSFLYYLLLHYQLRKSAKMPPAQIDTYLKKGAASRFCLVVVGIILVFQIPDSNIIAFLIGLLLPFRLVLFLNSIALLQKEFNKPAPRGEFYSTSVKHPLLHGRRCTWGR